MLRRVWLVLLTLVSASLLLQPGASSAADPCTALASEPLPFPPPAAAAGALSSMLAPELASRVVVEGGGGSFRYRVNGQETVIHGMGYNPRYHGLSVAERRALYERDFATMAEAGVNTVFGWNPTEFDGLLLDVAAQHGLGVAPPFDFDFHLDYGDPAVQQAVATRVLDWVEQLRTHPALRMWAIGNETLHKLVPPAWCLEQPTAEQTRRARAFTGFYAALIDSVRAVDPDHPIIYREAEDAYVSWMRTALAQGGPRPWFIYGLNVYTPRLAAILGDWRAQQLDTPLLASEFAPGPESRPAGYREYWATIRSHPGMVLGGSVYVWFTEGPEEVDRVYGLVDPNGQPVDGALEVIGELYNGGASH